MFDNDTSTEYNELHQQLMDSTIMMVDDEQINMEIIQIHLEESGYHNFILTDKSAEAMSIMEKELPDVLLLDLQMPGVSGFDILEAKRADERLRHIPVIILTSSTEAETKLKALELGATDFLSKPVDASELALRLRNTLTVKAYQDQLAYYDASTGLPNRSLFQDRLGWAIKQAERDDSAVAVMHIGIGQFKEINDTFGPKVGDALLKEITQRLKGQLRDSDVVTQQHKNTQSSIAARVGTSEFTVLLPAIGDVENAATVARRILAEMGKVFNFEGNELVIPSSIGIAAYPDDGNADTLLAKAASATSYAKKQGRNKYQFYSKEINEKSSKRLKLEGYLRKAIDNDELVLYYQPKIDTKTGHVTGMEALIRWISPELGFISPADFIPLAEETGLIVPIGEWVLHEACRQNQAWKLQGLTDLTISVNFSSEQFRGQDIARVVQDAIESSGLDPRCLVLEITESMIMGDPEKNASTLSRLKELKTSISIDDFGTGYSSLSYLKKFPLDELKIDRSFVMDLDTDDDDKAIVTAVIAMAHSLGLKTVAEGVENEAQLAFLKNLKCDQIQGFFYSKPLPKEELPAFVLQKNSL